MLNLFRGKAMTKYFILLLIAVSLSVSSGLSSKVVESQNRSAFVNPTPTPEPFAKIEKFELDRNEVFIPCRPGMKTPENCDESSSIKVKITAANPRNSALNYYYTVSGGRIIGKGASVLWDLSGVRAGTYTITAGIGGDAEAFAETQTKIVQVKECNCRYVDACPVIEISTPADPVKAGETVTFTAKIPGDFVSENTTYNWTVSAGTIVEGQGTPQIKVETMREMADGNLTATVEIGSERIAGICESTASKTVSLTK
jgi:hypothetical protein